MAIDLGQMVQAVMQATGHEEAPPAPKKPRLSTTEAMLVGAGLLVAGRLIVGGKGHRVIEALQSNGRSGDGSNDEEPATEDFDEYDEEPQARDDEDYDDEEDYDEEVEARGDDEEDFEEEEEAPRARRRGRAKARSRA